MKKFLALFLASAITVLAAPTQPTTPILNGKLLNPLDANGFRIDNLDTSNLNIPGGGGGTPLTDLTLNVPVVLFTNPVNFIISGGSVTGTMSMATQASGTVFANTTGSTASPTWVTLANLKSAAGLNLVDNTSDLSKPVSTATQTALDDKETVGGHATDIATVNAAIALKASTTTVNTALGLKADTTYVNTQDATKQNSWGVPGTNGYIAAGNTNGSLFWVDPTTLGTTNATYNDGASSNTSTTYSSPTQASFTNADTGKTITGTNIPASTTITFVNSTTVTLSHAATGTGSGLTFTIQNRFLGAGSGTVTLVSSGNLSPLFTTSVSSQSSTPTISYSLSNVSGNTFYGNSSSLFGAPDYMTAATARSVLSGGNTVGAAILSLTDPNAIRYIRINSNNSITLDTGAQLISDIGAEPGLGNPASNGQVLSSTTLGVRSFVSKENPLTFSAPFSRSTDTISIPQSDATHDGYLTSGNWSTFNGKENVLTFASPLARSGNSITLPVASSTASGYLLSGDWSTFNGKAPSTRTITTTAPITGGGDLSSNRTFAMAASTNSVDGYLTSADHTTFAAKSPSDSLISFTNNGTTGSPATTWTAGATAAYETVALDQNRYAYLPASSSYAPGKRITYSDPISSTNFGRYFRPSPGSGDLINGSSSEYRPFIDGTQGPFGRKSVEFQAVAGALSAGWQVVSPGSTLFHVEDSADATKQFAFSAASQPSGGPAGSVIAGLGNTVTVKSTVTSPNLPGVLFDIYDDGSVTKGQLNKVDVLPVVFEIGQEGVDINTSSVTVTDANTYDKVMIMGNLVAPLTIRFPSSVNYNKGESIIVVDKSSTITTTNSVTVVPPAVGLGTADTFNNISSSFVLDETNTQKTFTSDHSGNWSVPTNKTKIQGYQPIAGPGITIPPDPNAVEVHAQLNLANGANILSIPPPVDGTKFDFVVVQPSSSSAGTLSLPSVSRVENGGGGLITLSSVNSRVDTLRGRYNGTTGEFLWEAVKTNYTSIAVPATPTSLSTGSITASNVTLSWTDAATTEDAYYVERCQGSGCTSFAQIGAALPAGTNTYPDISVHAGTDYVYRVRCSNSGGFSLYSNTATASTTAGGPTADLYENHFDEGSGIHAVEVAPLGAANTTLSYGTDWTSSTQASAFALNLVAGVPSVTSPSAVATCSGTCASNWHYRVMAFATVGGLHGASVDLATGLTQSSTLDATHFNTINWTSVAGAAEYRVYRVTSGGTPAGLGWISINPQPGGGAGVAMSVVDNNLIATAPVIDPTATDIHKATPSSVLTYGSQISTSFWIKTTQNPSSSITFINGTSYSISMNLNKLVVSFTRAGGTPETASVSNTTIRNGSWHHIAVLMNNATSTQAGSEIKVYLDGDVTSNSGNGMVTTYTQTCTSGTCAQPFAASKPVIGSYTFAGAIDDFRVYNHLLTNTATTGEIALLYAGNAQ